MCWVITVLVHRVFLISVYSQLVDDTSHIRDDKRKGQPHAFDLPSVITIKLFICSYWNRVIVLYHYPWNIECKRSPQISLHGGTDHVAANTLRAWKSDRRQRDIFGQLLGVLSNVLLNRSLKHASLNPFFPRININQDHRRKSRGQSALWNMQESNITGQA